ncbi:MAG: carbohydrate kinase family protein [Pseudomonadota bacterium]
MSAETSGSGMGATPRRSLHVGSAMIDIICIVAEQNVERMTFSNDAKSFLMLEAGRKVPAQSISSHVGGGACNTAVSLARRGWDAAVLARTGNDHNAGAVRAHLAEHGVSADWVQTASDAATGTAVMVASHDRNASIFVHRGANEGIAEADLADAAFAGRDLVHIAPLSSRSADAFPAIAAKGRAAGAFVSANPGIRHLTSRTEALLRAMGDVDLISVNRVEAEALVPAIAAREGEGPDERLGEGAPELLRRGLSSSGFAMGLLRWLAAMRALGPRYVVLTDGTDGAWLAGPDGVIWRPSLPAEVAGTAGAGDSFTSTLGAALCEGVGAAEAMLQAAVNAASVVSAIDTTSGLLERAVLERKAATVGETALFEAA